MEQVKDTLRATVRISYDGKVYKTFRGPTPMSVSPPKFGCSAISKSDNVPSFRAFWRRIAAQLRIVTTNCGRRVEHLDDEPGEGAFCRTCHMGSATTMPRCRNVTYRQSDGRFCLIDFEFATILPEARD